MTTEEAPRDVRQQLAGGFSGQLIWRILWALSTEFATWGSRRSAIAVLVIGGFFILVGAAAVHRVNRFYPAFMIALGAHYLPFWFLDGMRMFGVLAALLVGAGLACGLHRAADFSLGAWLTAGTLVAFAFVGGAVAKTDQ